MNKNKMGFTLVELLAVVVILTVIIIIAIPVIDEVVENSRKTTFEASAKTIAAAAEKRKMENDILENTKTISCSDVVNLNSEDYISCTISFDGNTAKVSLIGSGKFRELLISEATKENANAEPSYAANYIKILYNDENLRTANWLKIDNTKDANIRYYGANPNNYVKFSDSDIIWRIIGIFDGYVKLVKSESIGNKQWHKGVSGVNGGWGINQWGASTYESGDAYAGADLQVYLNGDYYNSLSEVTKSAIDKHLWNTAGVEYNLRTDTVAFYNAERGIQTGKICDNGDRCNDTVKRTTTWNGYVALIYFTDWAYASAIEICEKNMLQWNDSNYICKNENWTQFESYNWFLSPMAFSSQNCNVYRVPGGRDIPNAGFSTSFVGSAVFPAVYLKSEVMIIDGSGLSTDPYILDIER